MLKRLTTADGHPFICDETEYWIVKDGRLYRVYFGRGVRTIVPPLSAKVILFLPERWPKVYEVSEIYKDKDQAQEYLNQLSINPA